MKVTLTSANPSHDFVANGGMRSIFVSDSSVCGADILIKIITEEFTCTFGRIACKTGNSKTHAFQALSQAKYILELEEPAPDTNIEISIV